MSKKGIILMNLGSPDSTAVKDVRRYLNEFLMDEKVIDYPWLFRALLVKGIIVPFRAPKSAKAYQTVWTKEGSPLMVISENLRGAVQQKMSEPVVLAMRYGNPTPKSAFEKLLEMDPEIDEVVLVPMYPHYAMSSYETAVDYAKEIHRKEKYPFMLTIVPPYYRDEEYLNALAESLKPYLEQDYDHLLFSFHGVPERHIKKGDITGCHCLNAANCCEVESPAHTFCYKHQCKKTIQLVTDKLGIAADKFSVSFQSRLGREEWLKPYTAKRLEALPGEGIKKLLVACPAFVSDCLETLEEIAVEGKETFLHAGGESFTVIPCMNVHPAWVETVVKYVEVNKSISQ